MKGKKNFKKLLITVSILIFAVLMVGGFASGLFDSTGQLSSESERRQPISPFDQPQPEYNQTEAYNRGYEEGYTAGYNDGSEGLSVRENYMPDLDESPEYYKGYNEGYKAGYFETNPEGMRQSSLCACFCLPLLGPVSCIALCGFCCTSPLSFCSTLYSQCSSLIMNPMIFCPCMCITQGFSFCQTMVGNICFTCISGCGTLAFFGFGCQVCYSSWGSAVKLLCSNELVTLNDLACFNIIPGQCSERLFTLYESCGMCIYEW
jgi:hypothetical protein